MRKKTTAAAKSTQTTHCPVQSQPTFVRITSVVAQAKIRKSSGATSGWKQRKIRPTKKPGTGPSPCVT